MAWLTVRQAAEKTKIVERTIRRYCDAHSVFIGWQKLEGKPLQIPEKSLDILRQIRNLYKEGKDAKQVNEHLLGEAPQNIEVSQDGAGPPVKLPQAFADIKEIAKSALQELDNIKQELANEKARHEEVMAALRDIKNPVSTQVLLPRAQVHRKGGVLGRLGRAWDAFWS